MGHVEKRLSFRVPCNSFPLYFCLKEDHTELVAEPSLRRLTESVPPAGRECSSCCEQNGGWHSLECTLGKVCVISEAWIYLLGLQFHLPLGEKAVSCFVSSLSVKEPVPSVLVPIGSAAQNSGTGDQGLTGRFRQPPRTDSQRFSRGGQHPSLGHPCGPYLQSLHQPLKNATLLSIL